MQNYQKISTTTAIRNETIDRSTDAYNANQRVRSPLYFRLRDVDLDGWSASAARKPTRCVIESRESWLLPLVSGCLLLFLARDHESRGKESERMEIGAIACVNSSRGLGSFLSPRSSYRTHKHRSSIWYAREITHRAPFYATVLPSLAI